MKKHFKIKENLSVCNIKKNQNFKVAHLQKKMEGET